MIRDALVVAGKDLRLEARSRVALNQVLPFALLVLVLFAFALDPDRGVLEEATPGLYWVAVLFSGLLALQRSFAVEAADGNRDALRLSGLDPAGIYLGKVLAVGAQLLLLEALLGVGVAVLYTTELDGWSLLWMRLALGWPSRARRGLWSLSRSTPTGMMCSCSTRRPRSLRVGSSRFSRGPESRFRRAGSATGRGTRRPTRTPSWRA